MYKLITLIGSFFGVLMWAEIISSLNVSAPRTNRNIVANLLFSFVIAGIFLMFHFILDRVFPERKWFYLFETLVVSAIGTVGVAGISLLFLIVLGYFSPNNLLLELGSTVMLSVMLFITNFAFILILRIIVHYLRKESRSDT